MPVVKPLGPHRFIGVDLAWAADAKHTGIAVMAGDRRGVKLVALSDDVHNLRSCLDFIVGHMGGGTTAVAIDASLIVVNEAGQRPCETAIGKQFGKFGASCHSTNRSRPYFESGLQLVRLLSGHGFAHGLPLGTSVQRWHIEVYPHPAMVRVFSLSRILQYKKGLVADRRFGLRSLQHHIGSLALNGGGLQQSPQLEELLGRDPSALRGNALKELEDLLDATFCAYLAWHCWRWGHKRNEVYGDLGTGYIVVPFGKRGSPVAAEG
jgi:predicted RNase H-like nuclease